jgi:hypothetical protein
MGAKEDLRMMISSEEGFAAMFEFLNRYWQEFKTAAVPDVLSDARPAYGGQSSDPAAWIDWQASV